MLTLEQKVDIRRHLNYGVLGDQFAPTGYFYSRRFHNLEYVMDHLTPEEERVLLGSEVAERPASIRYVVPCTDPVQVVQGYLPIVNFLENQMPLASDNMDTLSAGEWKANPNELPARAQIYNYYVRRMGWFLYIPVHEQPWMGFEQRVIN